MPVVDSTFHPPLWLRNGHLQTVLPVIWPGPRPREAPASEAERLELPDGDFLDLDWTRRENRRLVILSHGLEGDARAGYIRRLSGSLAEAKWDTLAWNFRGCGSEPNRLLRFYHSGETADLAAVIAHAAPRCDVVALVGFSLGGNVTLKYLGEAAPHPAVKVGVAVSAPVELAASARALDRRWANRIYLRRFIATLIAKVRAKAVRFPDRLDVAGIQRIRSFQEFDDRYTAPVHGFRDATDYWTQSSSRQFLPRINVPTLLLNARDDPFLPEACFPSVEATENGSFFLEAPSHGDHVGFLEGTNETGRTWLDRRVNEFLSRGGV